MRRRWLAASVPALALLFVSAWSFAEHTASARYVPYQGKLEHDGAPVNETVEMTFAFYTAPSGGSALDTVTLDVDVHEGTFAVDIGPVANTVFATSSLYLGVTVNGVELPMRQAIRAVPYAMHGQIGEVFSATEVAAGAVTAQSLHVSGNGRINNATIGDMGHGTSWAGFRHASVTDSGRYALLQNNAGSETLLNAGPGGRIGFRFGNSAVAELESDGTLELNRVVTGDGTVIGGLNVSIEYAVTASLAGGASIWDTTVSKPMTSASTSFCALFGEYVNYVSAGFGTGEYASHSGGCNIVNEGGTWVLKASAARAWHGHPVTHTCRARCLTWD